MHKYFLIPAIIFFIIISLIVIYLQFFYLDWKWDVLPDNFDVKTETYTKKNLNKSCDDNGNIKLIKLDEDIRDNRVFIDSNDVSNDPSIHAIYLLPCDAKDRNFDINNDIHFTIQSINNWFLEKTKNQIINFDYNDNFIDTTFIRVNKSINWFTKFNSIEDNKKDAATKIEDIILSNKNIFTNFENKKFIIFFEGWEKRRSITDKVCGRSRYNGKIAIFYTNEKDKKIKSCTKDNIDKSNKKLFGESEQTILHEILHTLGTPPKCGKNVNFADSLHVSDNNDDIMNKVSGSFYLDFNNDDYYKHNISDCPDLYTNKFLTNLKK